MSSYAPISALKGGNKYRFDNLPGKTEKKSKRLVQFYESLAGSVTKCDSPNPPSPLWSPSSNQFPTIGSRITKFKSIISPIVSAKTSESEPISVPSSCPIKKIPDTASMTLNPWTVDEPLEAAKTPSPVSLTQPLFKSSPKVKSTAYYTPKTHTTSKEPRPTSPCLNYDLLESIPTPSLKYFFNGRDHVSTKKELGYKHTLKKTTRRSTLTKATKLPFPIESSSTPSLCSYTANYASGGVNRTPAIRNSARNWWKTSNYHRDIPTPALSPWIDLNQTPTPSLPHSLDLNLIPSSESLDLNRTSPYLDRVDLNLTPCTQIYQAHARLPQAPHPTRPNKPNHKYQHISPGPNYDCEKNNCGKCFGCKRSHSEKKMAKLVSSNTKKSTSKKQKDEHLPFINPLILDPHIIQDLSTQDIALLYADYIAEFPQSTAKMDLTPMAVAVWLKNKAAEELQALANRSILDRRTSRSRNKYFDEEKEYLVIDYEGEYVSRLDFLRRRWNRVKRFFEDQKSAVMGTYNRVQSCTWRHGCYILPYI